MPIELEEETAKQQQYEPYFPTLVERILELLNRPPVLRCEFEIPCGIVEAVPCSAVATVHHVEQNLDLCLEHFHLIDKPNVGFYR